MDFTLKTYHHLLTALKAKGYTFQTFKDFLMAGHGNLRSMRSFHRPEPIEKIVVLRHDVDKKPGYALKMARLESKMGINSTYYFRAVPASWDETVIKEIAALGHEIGYHYEDLAIMNGDKEKATKHFEQQLERLRKLYPVETICMHGSPRSRWDSRNMWSDHDYRKYGIIGEPYFDVDFNEVFYLTDTGRRWDGEKFSIRDKVNCCINLSFRSTHDIINRLAELPQKSNDQYPSPALDR